MTNDINISMHGLPIQNKHTKNDNKQTRQNNNKIEGRKEVTFFTRFYARVSLAESISLCVCSVPLNLSCVWI